MLQSMRSYGSTHDIYFPKDCFRAHAFARYTILAAGGDALGEMEPPGGPVAPLQHSCPGGSLSEPPDAPGGAWRRCAA